jgi:hypothetical protein
MSRHVPRSPRRLDVESPARSGSVTTSPRADEGPRPLGAAATSGRGDRGTGLPEDEGPRRPGAGSPRTARTTPAGRRIWVCSARRPRGRDPRIGFVRRNRPARVIGFVWRGGQGPGRRRTGGPIQSDRFATKPHRGFARRLARHPGLGSLGSGPGLRDWVRSATTGQGAASAFAGRRIGGQSRPWAWSRVWSSMPALDADVGRGTAAGGDRDP